MSRLDRIVLIRFCSMSQTVTIWAKAFSWTANPRIVTYIFPFGPILFPDCDCNLGGSPFQIATYIFPFGSFHFPSVGFSHFPTCDPYFPTLAFPFPEFCFPFPDLWAIFSRFVAVTSLNCPISRLVTFCFPCGPFHFPSFFPISRLVSYIFLFGLFPLPDLLLLQVEFSHFPTCDLLFPIWAFSISRIVNFQLFFTCFRFLGLIKQKK